MFLLGVGLGMIVTVSGGVIALYKDGQRASKNQEALQEPLAAPVTHYHITLGEDAQLPKFLNKQFKTESEEVSEIQSVLNEPSWNDNFFKQKTLDWTKAFPRNETPVKEDKQHDEKRLERPYPSSSKGDSSKMSPSRSRAAKRKGKGRQEGR